MDESWRMPIGSWRRRSAGDYSRRDHYPRSDDALCADDFHDVFGGPPRTVLRRYYASRRHDEEENIDERAVRRGAFYESGEMHRFGTNNDLDNQLGFDAPWRNTGGSSRRERWWSAFKTEEGFFDDIFGSDGSCRRGSGRSSEPRRSRTRSCESSWSKSNSSSVTVQSSEDLSPLARFSSTISAAEDAALSAFASKLRPITIPTQRHNTPSPPLLPSTTIEDSAALRSPPSHGNLSYDLPWSKPSLGCFHLADEKRHRSFGSFRCSLPPLPLTPSRHSQRHSSPDSITIDASTLWSMRKTASSLGGGGDEDDDDSHSLSSTSSSVSMSREEKRAAMEELGRAVVIDLDDDDLLGVCEEEEDGEEDAAARTDTGSSWFARVMAVDPCQNAEAQASTSSAVDEAIAWAREKFLIRMPDDNSGPRPDGVLGRLEENTGMMNGMGITA